MSADEEISVAPRRGRPRGSSPTALGSFLQQRITQMGMTQQRIAPLLGTTASRLSRLIAGKVTFSQPIDGELWCRILKLDEMNRLTFLRLMAGAATSFALASGAPPQSKSAPRTYQIDLDLAHDLADALQRLLEHGETQHVHERAHQWFATLTQEYPTTRDPRIARAQIRFGMLLGAAQEATLPWYQRPQVAIQTYSVLVEQVLAGFPLNDFSAELARILERRAPLEREREQYANSLADFDDAISLLHQHHDPELTITLLRTRAHVYAVLGDEVRWLRDLHSAILIANRLPDSLQKLHVGLLDYSRAEGYKRLAYNIYKPFTLQQRERYAQLSWDRFQHAAYLKEFHSASHKLLANVSEAQALIWLDPPTAQAQLAGLRSESTRVYPALLNKIERSEEYVSLRLHCRTKEQATLFFDSKRKSPLH